MFYDYLKNNSYYLFIINCINSVWNFTMKILTKIRVGSYLNNTQKAEKLLILEKIQFLLKNL